MSHEQRVCLVPALSGFRVLPISYYGTASAGTAAGSGPPGTASMLFFCWFVTPRRVVAGAQQAFGRGRNGVGGYAIVVPATSAGLVQVNVHNAAAGLVQFTSAGLTTFDGLDVPYLVLASYQDGVITVWLNGILAGTTGAAGAGYLALVNPLTIGCASNNAASLNASDLSISDCGMLQDYDVSTYVDPVFGNGGPGLSARWLADLREGRYLTWPRAGAVNSDWYWAGRDVVRELATLPTWTDRYTGDVVTKFGQPQPACFPARPI